MDEITRSKLDSAVVGSRIWFEGESKPYKVRARSERFIICTKPFNPKKTVLYTVIDLSENVRGPDNIILGLGYETDEQISKRLDELVSGEIEVSHRRRVELDVSMVSV